MLQKFQFRAGISREATAYANEGGWYDGDKIRFRAGLPEKIGGWVKATSNRFLGSCRAMHEWSALDGNRFLALGTHLKHYIMWGSQFYDITPLRAKDQLLGANPFITAGGPYLIVTHVAHAATVNDFVVFVGADLTAHGGSVDPDPDNHEPHPVYTANDLNKEHQIIEIIDKDHYKVHTGIPGDPGLPAGGMGGAVVKATYQIHTGLDIAIPGAGWGASPWGGLALADGGGDPIPPNTTTPPFKGGWGEPYYVSEEEGTVPVNQIRLWAQDNFGEDLVFNIRQGGVFYWKRTFGPNQRAIELYEYAKTVYPPEPPNPAFPDIEWVPRWAFEVMCSEVDRHVIAIGTNDFLQNYLDPLLIRWSDAENISDWEPRRNNSAGAMRLSSGSRLRGALRTRQEILIWTDKNLQSLRFIGAPYWFGLNLLAENVSMLCPSAAVNAGGRVYWMDRNGFYVYSGQVQDLPCAVRDYVFGDFNMAQSWKVTAGHNHNFQEVIWFYPSGDTQEVNKYVVYNYVENTWVYGNLIRTCWLDQVWSDSFPVATNNGYLYHHEKGDDDDGEALSAWVESSDVDLDDGEKYMFIRRVVPDVVFRGNGDTQSVGLSLRMRPAPGAQFITDARSEITPHTKYCWTRARGRQMVVRLESNSKGTGWRVGALRFDLQPDGRK